jgi:hypothetical protein
MASREEKKEREEKREFFPYAGELGLLRGWRDPSGG